MRVHVAWCRLKACAHPHAGHKPSAHPHPGAAGNPCHPHHPNIAAAAGSQLWIESACDHALLSLAPHRKVRLPNSASPCFYSVPVTQSWATWPAGGFRRGRGRGCNAAKCV
eukprot:scaffold17264_cov25-Tisochrysis_lutea.AAC.2